MTQTNVTPFVRISLKHLFYKDGNMRDLKFVPNLETTKLMNEMGVFLRLTSSSILLAYSEKTKTYLENADQKVMFVFSLQNSDPFFQIITKKIPYAPNEQLLYFDNLQQAANDGNVILLHDTDFVSNENLYEIKNTQQYVTIDDIDVKQLVIVDRQGNDIQTYKVDAADEKFELKKKKENGQKQTGAVINLKEDAPGLFQMKINEELDSTFYCGTPQGANNLGRLHLYIDVETLKAQENEKAIKLNYEIRFANRKVYWRYFFIDAQSKEKVQPDSFSISHSQKDISFSAATEKTLTNGVKAVEVISQEAIPLEEQYEGVFSVRFKYKKEGAKEISIPLPNAGYQNITRSKEDEDVFYSDIYVYL